MSVPGHTLTIAKEGRADVNVLAKRIVVVGTGEGHPSRLGDDLILSTAVVSGDVSAPRLMLEEGASVHATLDMQAFGRRDCRGALSARGSCGVEEVTPWGGS